MCRVSYPKANQQYSASLEDVTSIANKVSGSMATAAASLDRCSVPNRGVQQSLPYGDLEYGMGSSYADLLVRSMTNRE